MQYLRDQKDWIPQVFFRVGNVVPYTAKASGWMR